MAVSEQDYEFLKEQLLTAIQQIQMHSDRITNLVQRVNLLEENINTYVSEFKMLTDKVKDIANGEYYDSEDDDSFVVDEAESSHYTETDEDDTVEI